MIKNEDLNELMEINVENGNIISVYEQYKSYFIVENGGEEKEIERQEVVKLTKEIIHKFLRKLSGKTEKIDALKQFMYKFIVGTTKYELKKEKHMKYLAILAYNEEDSAEKITRIANLIRTDITAKILVDACIEEILEINGD